jgi:hypothetical protein
VQKGKEAVCAHPSVLLGLLPRLSALADADNHVQAVVAGVEALSVALRAVADECERVVLEVLLELGEGPVCVWKGRREEVSSGFLGDFRRVGRELVDVRDSVRTL